MAVSALWELKLEYLLQCTTATLWNQTYLAEMDHSELMWTWEREEKTQEKIIITNQSCKLKGRYQQTSERGLCFRLYVLEEEVPCRNWESKNAQRGREVDSICTSGSLYTYWNWSHGFSDLCRVSDLWPASNQEDFMTAMHFSYRHLRFWLVLSPSVRKEGTKTNTLMLCSVKNLRLHSVFINTLPEWAKFDILIF